MNKTYAEASTEVLDIINHMTKEDRIKIPEQFIEFLEKNAIKDYKFQFDYTKKLREMKLREETREILTIMYKEYLCNEKEKEELKKILYKNELEHQKKLRETYNPEDLFKPRKTKNNNF